jgi:hypothetical protein
MVMFVKVDLINVLFLIVIDLWIDVQNKVVDLWPKP